MARERGWVNAKPQVVHHQGDNLELAEEYSGTELCQKHRQKGLVPAAIIQDSNPPAASESQA